MVLKQLPVHTQNINVDLALSLYTKTNSKRVTDLNATLRPLGRINIEENRYGLRLVKMSHTQDQKQGPWKITVMSQAPPIFKNRVM